MSAAGTFTTVAAGNLMVNAPGVTLKELTVTGDLILGEGDVTLSGVTVQGRLVVRGGGGNSIHIADQSSVGSVVLGKTAVGAVRLLSEGGAKVASVSVDDGLDGVILQGSFDAVTVGSAAGVVLQDATVSSLRVQAKKAAVSLEGKPSVENATVDARAEGLPSPWQRMPKSQR